MTNWQLVLLGLCELLQERCAISWNDNQNSPSCFPSNDGSTQTPNLMMEFWSGTASTWLHLMLNHILSPLPWRWLSCYHSDGAYSHVIFEKSSQNLGYMYVFLVKNDGMVSEERVDGFNPFFPQCIVVENFHRVIMCEQLKMVKVLFPHFVWRFSQKCYILVILNWFSSKIIRN